MRHGSLDDPLAKLQRSAEHYVLIKNAFGERDHQLIPLRMVQSVDGLECKFFAEDIPALPGDISLMLADAYHNARVALDHLVFQLHVRHYRGLVPLNVEGGTAFPIHDTAQNNGPDHWRSIKNLGKKERTTIERLQPYRQRPGPLYGIREHLSDLSRIDNVDKHRRLHVTREIAQAVPTLDTLLQYGLQHRPAFGEPIETGSLIDTWTFDRRPPDTAMRHDWKFRLGASFEVQGRKFDLIPHLGGSIHAVARVISRFRGLFPSSNVALDLSHVRRVEQLH